VRRGPGCGKCCTSSGTAFFIAGPTGDTGALGCSIFAATDACGFTLGLPFAPSATSVDVPFGASIGASLFTAPATLFAVGGAAAADGAPFGDAVGNDILPRSRNANAAAVGTPSSALPAATALPMSLPPSFFSANGLPIGAVAASLGCPVTGSMLAVCCGVVCLNESGRITGNCDIPLGDMPGGTGLPPLTSSGIMLAGDCIVDRFVPWFTIDAMLGGVAPGINDIFMPGICIGPGACPGGGVCGIVSGFSICGAGAALD
jgi:hypothetical protein